jgi:hydroxymethylglutaryl-CoA synthase
MKTGIDAISFYTSHYYIDLRTLAKARNVDADKYYIGIGQEKMAVPPPDEDIVTMAANAGKCVLESGRPQKIDMVLFATESGIDQSKSAGIYVHKLLDLLSACRVIELKQACYSATAALQIAVHYVRQNPHSQVLVLASDVARYGLGTSGEATQGAGAIAMVVSAEPRIMAIEPISGFYTEDVMDFWRPNYRDEALVDGKYSVKIYLKALAESWANYQQKSGRNFADLHRYCYHSPFTKMAEKAHQHMLKNNGVLDPQDEKYLQQIKDSLIYNRIVGNSYAASLYIGIIALLENSTEDLAGKRLGMFSYGSGCVGEFFSGIIEQEYQKHLFKRKHQEMLKNRTELSCAEYEKFYSFALPTDGSKLELPKAQTGFFRLEAVENHKRIYHRSTTD